MPALALAALVGALAAAPAALGVRPATGSERGDIVRAVRAAARYDGTPARRILRIRVSRDGRAAAAGVGFAGGGSTTYVLSLSPSGFEVSWYSAVPICGKPRLRRLVADLALACP